MALKNYKPTTPSQRNLVIVDRSGLYSGKPVKSLAELKTATAAASKIFAILLEREGQQVFVAVRPS